MPFHDLCICASSRLSSPSFIFLHSYRAPLLLPFLHPQLPLTSNTTSGAFTLLSPLLRSLRHHARPRPKVNSTLLHKCYTTTLLHKCYTHITLLILSLLYTSTERFDQTPLLQQSACALPTAARSQTPDPKPQFDSKHTPNRPDPKPKPKPVLTLAQSHRIVPAPSPTHFQ